jgi:hypothetical protein
MNTKILLLLLIFNLWQKNNYLQAQIDSAPSPFQSTWANSNCNNSQLINGLPVIENGTYVSPNKSLFEDIYSIPVSNVAVNNDYVRVLASYKPESGTPVNLLPGSDVASKPVEQVVNYDDANYKFNKPVGYTAYASPSVGKYISTDGDLKNYDNAYTKSLNKYSGLSTDNNRGSLITGNY